MPAETVAFWTRLPLVALDAGGAAGERAAGDVIVVDIDVAEPIGGADLHRADMGVEGRAGISRIDVGEVRVGAGAQRRGGGRDVGLAAGRDRAGVERQGAGDQLDMGGGEAGVDVMVLQVAVPGDAALVIVADRRGDAPALDGRVDAAADPGIGEDVAAIEIGGQHLLDLEIGMDARMRLAVARRGGEQPRGGKRGERERSAFERGAVHWPYP